MREIIARDKPFTKEVWSREKAKRRLCRQGRDLQGRADRRDPGRRGPQDLCPGRLVRPLPRSAYDLDGQDRHRLQADEGGGRLLARRFEQPDADPHLRHGLAPGRRSSTLISAARGGGEARPPPPRPRDGPVPFPGGGAGRRVLAPERLDDVPGADRLYAPPPASAATRRSMRPQILDKSLWETSGHWGWYRENMFVTQTEDERVFAIKPMNCPGHVQIFKHGLKSYRDLPLRLAEFGAVSRYEPSGALHGLMRVRAFTQDDAHIFCTEDQIAAECLKINDLILSTYADFGFDEIVVKLSTRPDKRVGTDEMWDHAEDVHDARPQADRGAVRRTASRPGSIRARARSTGRNSNTCCAMPSAATGNAAPRRWTSTCRSGSAPSTSTRTGRRRRRRWCTGRSAARWSASSAS